MEDALSQQEHLLGVRGEHSLIGGDPHPEQGPDAIVESVMTEAAQVIGAPLLTDTQGAVAVPPEEESVWPMEVDDPNSPITASDDAILSGAGEAGVEEMAMLRVNSTP